MTITLESAEGWASHSRDPRDRSLAWYGYTDSKGNTYPDLSSTRSVARDLEHGMWNVGDIQGNVITLRAQWNGPALSSGTAIRNAVDGPSLIPSLIDRSSLGEEHSTAISGTWVSGIMGQWDSGQQQVSAGSCIFPHVGLDQSVLTSSGSASHAAAVAWPAFEEVSPKRYG